VLIILGCCLAVGLGAAGIILWNYQPWQSKQIPGEANTGSSPFLAFDKFLINIRDDSGKNMIVFCDLALEAADPGRISPEQKMDLRRAVYRKFKQRRADQIRVPKFKQEFAGELKAELNGIYGGNFIKNVYFTRFIIL
jgi:flagellar basal body-associated protein FliL